MAIVKFGGSIAGLRGTIGGITYSANASSNYAKAWAKGPRSQTLAAATERARLASWAPRWAALNAFQVASWNTYAAAAAQAKTDPLGQTYYASGFNWFVECNTARALCGLAYALAAPANPAPAAPAITLPYFFQSPGNVGRHYIPIASWTATNYLLAYAWVSNRTTLATIPMSRYVFLRGVLGTISGGNYQFNIDGYSQTKLGTLSPGLRLYHLCYTMQPEGRCSPPSFYQSNVLT